MSARQYTSRDYSFWYDFAEYGGAIGFLPLYGSIPVGFTVLSANIHTILGITGVGTRLLIASSIDGNLTNKLEPDVLLTGTTVPFLITDDRIYGTVIQNLGLQISNAVITAGRAVIIVRAVVITET